MRERDKRERQRDSARRGKRDRRKDKWREGVRRETDRMRERKTAT